MTKKSPMTTQEAINAVNEMNKRFESHLFELTVKNLDALKRLNINEVSSGITKLLKESESALIEIDIDYAEKVHKSVDAYIESKHRAKARTEEIRAYLQEKDGRIDGETSSIIILLVQSILHIISIPIIFLIFGSQKDKLDDTFYYCVGSIPQVAVLIIMMIVKIINKKRVAKEMKDSPYSFEELIAVKYEDKNPLTRLFMGGATNVSIVVNDTQKGKNNIKINNSVVGGKPPDTNQPQARITKDNKQKGTGNISINNSYVSEIPKINETDKK